MLLCKRSKNIIYRTASTRALYFNNPQHTRLFNSNRKNTNYCYREENVEAEIENFNLNWEGLTLLMLIIILQVRHTILWSESIMLIKLKYKLRVQKSDTIPSLYETMQTWKMDGIPSRKARINIFRHYFRSNL